MALSEGTSARAQIKEDIDIIMHGWPPPLRFLVFGLLAFGIGSLIGWLIVLGTLLAGFLLALFLGGVVVALVLAGPILVYRWVAGRSHD